MAEFELHQLESLRQKVSEPAKDLKINLSNVLQSEVLSAEQTWGIALSAAYYIGHAELLHAVLEDAKQGGAGDDVIHDAQAAAALMGMNTVYYRFRHLVGKEDYAKKAARLRMQRMLKPETNKGDFELFSMAVAVLAGCETCIQAHEKSILENGLSQDHVHDAVRLAAVLQGVAVALSYAE